jgi:hypothetical protein
MHVWLQNKQHDTMTVHGTNPALRDDFTPQRHYFLRAPCSKCLWAFKLFPQVSFQLIYRQNYKADSLIAGPLRLTGTNILA